MSRFSHYYLYSFPALTNCMTIIEKRWGAAVANDCTLANVGELLAYSRSAAKFSRALMHACDWTRLCVCVGVRLQQMKQVKEMKGPRVVLFCCGRCLTSFARWRLKLCPHHTTTIATAASPCPYLCFLFLFSFLSWPCCAGRFSKKKKRNDADRERKRGLDVTSRRSEPPAESQPPAFIPA